MPCYRDQSLAVTWFAALGIRYKTVFEDIAGRTLHITHASPVTALLGSGSPVADSMVLTAIRFISSRFNVGITGWLALSLALAVIPVRADEGVEFFEQKIRPVLVDRCYSCHSAEAVAKKTLKGGLLLDTREAIRKGGDSGPAVLPEKPADSLLIAAIRHESIEMPPNGKLADQVIARHYPQAAAAENPCHALLEGVIARQGELIARWQGLGWP